MPAKKVKKVAVAAEGEKVNVYSVKGEKVKQVSLPPVFMLPVRTDIIRRAFHAVLANRRQPYGRYAYAAQPYGAHRIPGMKRSVEWAGKGRGVSRVPRLKDSMTGSQAPNCVGGRDAHPPRAEKDWSKKVNKKEKLLARKSALAATKEHAMVKARGHKFADKLTLPVIVEGDGEGLNKTTAAEEFLEKVGLSQDVERAKAGKHVRAGKGKMRGRKYRIPKSILVLAENPENWTGLQNLPGVDIVNVKNVNVEHLAPGGVPGRLTIISEKALEKLAGW
ncbi:MAG: 50S ribosomal protein L4 [Thermoplasmata archaeon]|nr:50S ribosomal protein L4 [Thermoplasmata archaeon]